MSESQGKLIASVAGAIAIILSVAAVTNYQLEHFTDSIVRQIDDLKDDRLREGDRVQSALERDAEALSHLREQMARQDQKLRSIEARLEKFEDWYRKLDRVLQERCPNVSN